jgi:DNA-binding response OmpR family regulator
MSNGATILVIEDDPAMLAGLKDNLEIEGYRVLSATSVQRGRAAALQGNPDLIVLDVMLPDGDGVGLCRDLRANGLRQPIIMLTARSEEMDKVMGFEGGADDYVVKPFGLRELLARIHAQLRRTAELRQIQVLVAVGMSVVDFRRHQLTRDGIPQEVSAKELELLRYMVLHRGDVVSRETLLAQVWGHQREVETRTIDNFIVRLRKKIELDPAAPQYLITIHGIGYKLVEQ